MNPAAIRSSLPRAALAAPVLARSLSTSARRAAAIAASSARTKATHVTADRTIALASAARAEPAPSMRSLNRSLEALTMRSLDRSEEALTMKSLDRSLQASTITSQAYKKPESTKTQDNSKRLVAKLIAAAVTVSASAYLYLHSDDLKEKLQLIKDTLSIKHDIRGFLYRGLDYRNSEEKNMRTQAVLAAVFARDPSAFSAEDILYSIQALNAFHKVEPKQCLSKIDRLISLMIDELTKDNNKKLLSLPVYSDAGSPHSILTMASALASFSSEYKEITDKLNNTIFNYLHTTFKSIPLNDHSRSLDLISKFLLECSKANPELCKPLIHQINSRLVTNFSDFSRSRRSFDTIAQLLSASKCLLSTQKTQEDAKKIQTAREFFALVGQDIVQQVNRAFEKQTNSIFKSHFHGAMFVKDNFRDFVQVVEAFSEMNAESPEFFAYAAITCHQLINFDLLARGTTEQLATLNTAFAKSQLPEQFRKRFAAEVQKTNQWVPPVASAVYSPDILKDITLKIASQIVSWCGINDTIETKKKIADFKKTQAAMVSANLQTGNFPFPAYERARLSELEESIKSPQLTEQQREKLVLALQQRLQKKLLEQTQSSPTWHLGEHIFETLMEDPDVTGRDQSILKAAAKEAGIDISSLVIPSSLFVRIWSQIGPNAQNMLVSIHSFTGHKEVLIPIPKKVS